MLHYPKMAGSGAAPAERCIAFEKYDGTNLHWDWDRDFGWHDFGTRRDSFDLSPAGRERFDRAHPGLESAADIFLATLADGLEAVFQIQTAVLERPPLPRPPPGNDALRASGSSLAAGAALVGTAQAPT